MEFKFRLIKNNKIVGYEWHKTYNRRNDCNVEIFHSIFDDDTEKYEWYNVLLLNEKWIEHDNKDIFINRQDINNKNVYTNDYYIGQYNEVYKIVINKTYERLTTGHGETTPYLRTECCLYVEEDKLKIIGSIYNLPIDDKNYIEYNGKKYLIF